MKGIFKISVLTAVILAAIIITSCFFVKEERQKDRIVEEPTLDKTEEKKPIQLSDSAVSDSSQMEKETAKDGILEILSEEDIYGDLNDVLSGIDGLMLSSSALQHTRFGGSVSGVTRRSQTYIRNWSTPGPDSLFPEYNTEEYDRIYENPFLEVIKNPLSTFSIDVDAASYANVRRFINNNQLPPRDASRIEEMVNYFTYDYPQPEDEQPFSITTEISICPWEEKHLLAHIGLQGKKLDLKEVPPSNLVFLIDVSGSMGSAANKLPLLKSSFRLLVNQLKKQDRVAIVVYAGSAGIVLPSTSGDKKNEIFNTLERLSAGGYTAGGAGIQLAYKIARENLIKDGNNRVILATDGDFNIGASSDAELERMIEEKREQGIFLTVLGFGMGNYKDSKMEKLADKGNGNYAYIDNILEAKKVFINELGGTLFTIAKDVKIQVEFNPTKVHAYRLIGYENRMLRAEDFKDDTKDAGELGAGHTVTALYELIPTGAEADIPDVDELKYQETKIKEDARESNELMLIKFRYKEPDGEKSKLIEKVVTERIVTLANTSNDYRFSAAVAGFGLLLRDSEYKGKINFEQILALSRQSKGKDKFGYRYEFVTLVEKSQLLFGDRKISEIERPPSQYKSMYQELIGIGPDTVLSHIVPQGNLISSSKTEAIDFGQRSIKEIEDVITSHDESISYCYKKELRLNPNLKGQVQIEFVIRYNGKVDSINVINSTLGNKKVESCIQRRVRSWRFKPINDNSGNVRVKQLYVFGT